MNWDEVYINNRDLLRGTLDAVPDATILLDHDGCILMANDPARKLLEYSADELIGTTVTRFMTEPSVRTYLNYHRKILSSTRINPKATSMELYRVDREGRESPTEIRLGRVEGDGKTYLCCSLRDTSERKQARKDSKASVIVQSTVASILRISLEPIPLQEVLQRTLEQLITVPWIGLQSKGAIFLVEDEPETLVMKAQVGLSPHLLNKCKKVALGHCLCGRAGASGEILFTDEVDEKHEIHYEGMDAHGHFCVPIRSNDHTEGVINLYVETGHRRKPEEETFLLSVADVLAGAIKRSRIEENLRNSEERFALAVKGTDAGIWDWDLRTDDVYFSPRWKSMLGYEEHEITNSFAEWENRLHADDRERAFTTLQRYLKGRTQEYELEHRLRHRDGTYRWILARGAAVSDVHGQAFRMVGSHIDMTERKQMEKALRHKEAQLLAAQDVQRRILPKAPPPLPGYDLAGATFPASFTAGDLFDYITMTDQSLGLVIGDVSGHGVGPALVMASTHAYLHAHSAIFHDIDEIMARTNVLLAHEIDTDMFVSAFFGRLIPETRSFIYASAGHPPGVILDRNGALKAELKKTSIPLGIMKDATFPVAEPILLEPGDLMLLLTDGMLELRSPEGQFFGMERTLQAVRSVQEKPAKEIVNHLYEASRDFSKHEKPEDDLTLLVLKVEPDAIGSDVEPDARESDPGK